MMKNKFYIIIPFLILFYSCVKDKAQKPWKYEKTIEIEGVNPIGIAGTKEGFWISDGDHNRLVLINLEGLILKEIDGFDRPMHIDKKENSLYIPEYGSDQITILNNTKKTIFSLKDSLDAPAAVSLFNEEIAIVDFYKHRVLYNNGAQWISFGKEGKAKGYFYFPTDVQITENEIFVADAYNNRIQVFDKKGKFIKIIGANQKMNAATGMYVANEELFVTDFENNRVLIFNLDGTVKQELKGNVNKPIDAIISNEKLYINNFREQSISIFARN